MFEGLGKAVAHGGNYEQAYAFVTTLINSFENTNLPEFIELAKMFKNWKEYIVNSFNKDEYG